MNLKNFILATSVVLTALSIQVASAQTRGGHAASAPRTTSPAGSNFGGHFSNNGSRWSNHGGSDRWRNGSGWSHNRCYYPSYSYFGGFGYPYGYGFGYPFGYGYGFGYPYYGASASFYYNGYRSSGYRDGGGSLVTEVQKRLARSGYYRGAIDGMIGSGTRGAIRAWERAHGLRVDGRIDNQLLSTLGIA